MDEHYAVITLKYPLLEGTAPTVRNAVRRTLFEQIFSNNLLEELLSIGWQAEYDTTPE